MQGGLVFGDIWRANDLLVDGLLATLWLSSVVICVGAGVGIAGAVARTSGSSAARAVSTTYVEAVRNTPLLVQIFLVYFGLPSLGLRVSATEAALIALVVNLGAYTTEIIRAGIVATHPAQIEAAASLGLTPRQIFWDVVLIPALDRVWPALSSQFVLIMLASSIVSQIGFEELTSAAALIDSRTYRSTEVYIVTAALYLGLTLLFRNLLRLFGLAIFARRRTVGRRA